MQTKQRTTHYDCSNQREQTTQSTPPQQRKLLMKEVSMKFPCADPAPTKSTQQKVSKLTYRQGKKEDHQLPRPPPTIDSKPGKTTTEFDLRTLGTSNTSPPTTTTSTNPTLKPCHSSAAPKKDNTNPAQTTRNIKTTSNTSNVNPAPKKDSNKPTTRETDSTQATPKHNKYIPTSSKAEPSTIRRLQKGSAINAADAGCNTGTTKGENKEDMSPRNTKGKQGMAVITAKSSNTSLKKEKQRSAGCHHRKPNRGSTSSFQLPPLSKPRDRIHRPKTAPTGQHKREIHTLSLKHNSSLPHLFSPLSYLLSSDLSSPLNSCSECYSLYSPSSRRVVYALIEKPLRVDNFLPHFRSNHLSIRGPQVAREGLLHRTVASSKHSKKTKSSARSPQRVREGPDGHTETNLEYRHSKAPGQRGAGAGTGDHTEATPEHSEVAGQQRVREGPGDHTEAISERSEVAGQRGAREGPGVYTETHPERRHEEARQREARGAASNFNGRPQRPLETLATPQPGFYKLQFSIRNYTHCTTAYYVSWVQCKTLQTFEGLCPTIVCVMFASAHLDKSLAEPRLVIKHTNSSITKQTHKHRHAVKVRRRTSHKSIRDRHSSMNITCTLVTMNYTLGINCYKTPLPKVILHPALQIKLWGGADFGILRVNHTSQNSKLSPSTKKWMLKQNFTSAKEIYRDMPQNCLLSYKINRVKTISLYFIQRNIFLISNKTKETLSYMQSISKSIHYTPPIKNHTSEVHRANTQKHLLYLINIKPNSLDLVIKLIFSKIMTEPQSRQSINTEPNKVQPISIKSIYMQSFRKSISSSEIHRVNPQKCLPSLLNKRIKINPDRVLKLIFPTKHKVIELECIQSISMKSSIVQTLSIQSISMQSSSMHVQYIPPRKHTRTHTKNQVTKNYKKITAHHSQNIQRHNFVYRRVLYLTHARKSARHIVQTPSSLGTLHSAPQTELWGEGTHKTTIGNSAKQKIIRILTRNVGIPRMSHRATNSTSSQKYKEKLLALENDPDVDMFVTQKRSSSSQAATNQKKAKGRPIPGSTRPPFWLGYQALNWTNRGKGLPKDSPVPIATLVKNGMREKEAREHQSSIPSFPFVIQEEWPNSREDGKIGQHFNLTQIPADVEVDKFGFSFDYQIAITFELGEKDWEKDTILSLVEARLKDMDIKLGEVIGEPIAIMCFHKSTKWSGVLKLHLKTPEIDGVGLLQGLRPFILQLEEDKPKRGKVCKTYDSLALNNLLSVKITSEGLEFKEWYEVLEKIVEESFQRGMEYEITNVQKKKENLFAWVVASSPEQALRMKEHQITYNHEILDGKLADRTIASKDDIARKNALIVIAKNLNKAKSTDEIEESIKAHMGAKNAVSFFFKKDEKNGKHLGSCNIQCLNAMVYKTFTKKSVKLLGKYVEFTPHPRSLDGANAPNESELIRLGFSDVYTALANTIEALENIPAKENTHKVLMKEISGIREEITTMKQELRSEQQLIAEKAAEKCTSTLNTQMTLLKRQLATTMQALEMASSSAIEGNMDTTN